MSNGVCIPSRQARGHEPKGQLVNDYVRLPEAGVGMRVMVLAPMDSGRPSTGAVLVCKHCDAVYWEPDSTTAGTT
jgi:hypothetical protein